MRGTQVQSLGREDPLEKEMAPYSSTLAWKIPWTEERGRLQSMGLQRVKQRLNDFTRSINYVLNLKTYRFLNLLPNSTDLLLWECGRYQKLCE